MKATFEQWKRMVDVFLMKRIGMESDDLPDYDYRRDYDVNTPALTTAKRAARAASEF
jgi:hypothetical protein